MSHTSLVYPQCSISFVALSISSVLLPRLYCGARIDTSEMVSISDKSLSASNAQGWILERGWRGRFIVWGSCGRTTTYLPLIVAIGCNRPLAPATCSLPVELTQGVAITVGHHTSHTSRFQLARLRRACNDRLGVHLPTCDLRRILLDLPTGPTVISNLLR